MNDDFNFDSSIACFEFFRILWVNRWCAVRSLTKRNNKTRSCTWAKRIHLWRLLSSCRAPLRVTPNPNLTHPVSNAVFLFFLQSAAHCPWAAGDAIYISVYIFIYLCIFRVNTGPGIHANLSPRVNEAFPPFLWPVLVCFCSRLYTVLELLETLHASHGLKPSKDAFEFAMTMYEYMLCYIYICVCVCVCLYIYI